MREAQNSFEKSNSLNNKDELSDCLLLLWSYKSVIVLCICIFISCALLYSTQKKLEWSLLGDISVASLNQGETSYKVSNRENVSKEKLFEVYSSIYNSLENKVNFSNNNKGLNVIPNNLTLNKKTYQASYKSNDKGNINNILVGYNKYISNLALEKINLIIYKDISDEKNDIFYKYNKLLLEAKEKVVIEKNKTKYAIRIAQAAQIIKPLANISSDKDVFNISLGVLGLKEKLNILNDENVLPIFEPKLLVLEKENAKLGKVLTSHEFYINNPYVIKVNKIQLLKEINTSYLVMIALVLGVILGSASIIVFDFIRNFKK
ncbi:hypothetical protein [Photobacterium phosphoreum]|uniref:hypothetical protein n=1 Tax=Photobacterium phosphoreum TaxID=659 RepID=UPI00242ECE86|nr:hypothetical protein [Photobacterium phosphoreum]